MKNLFQKLSSKVFFSFGFIAFSTAIALAPNSAKADMMGMPPTQPTTDSMTKDHDMMKKDHEAMKAQSQKGSKKQMQQKKETPMPMNDAPMMDDDAMAPDKPQDPGMSDDM